ncbi:uncharacterized protein LOC144124239 [Amblyomma americanum]
MMRTWTILAWRFVLTLALLLLVLYLIVSGMVWAAKQVATRKQRATDISLETGLSRSIYINVTDTMPRSDPSPTSKKTDIDTTSSTAQISASNTATASTTTEKTTTAHTTEATTITSKPPTASSKTTITETTTTSTTAAITTTMETAPTTTEVTTATEFTEPTEPTTTQPTTTQSTTTQPTTIQPTSTEPTKTTIVTTTKPTTTEVTTSTTNTPTTRTTTKRTPATTTAKRNRGIVNCSVTGREFKFCEKTIPGVYKSFLEGMCYNVTDELPYLCNDGVNRFSSADECHKKCVESDPPHTSCEVVPELIPCRKRHLKKTWWFHRTYGSRCVEWSFREGRCPLVNKGEPQFNTKAECMETCKGNAVPRSCLVNGTGVNCPVEVMREPHFAFRHKDGRMRCYTADIETMREHRCIDETRRYTHEEDCWAECSFPSPAFQLQRQRFRPMWSAVNGAVRRTILTKRAPRAAK